MDKYKKSINQNDFNNLLRIKKNIINKKAMLKNPKLSIREKDLIEKEIQALLNLALSIVNQEQEELQRLNC